MNRSTERFLTTHTGSLPRPDDLIRSMFAKEEGVPVDAAALAQRVASAVEEVVQKQAQAGIDVIDDGEMSKPSYATYIKDRLSGFGGEGNTFVYQDLTDFPRLAKRVFGDPGRSRRKTPACNAPIAVRDPQRGGDRRRTFQGGAREGPGRGRVHDGGVAGRRFALLQERALSEPRKPISRRSRRPCATSTRRSPRPGSRCRSTVPISGWGGTSSMRI